jgi:hypothetical protein
MKSGRGGGLSNRSMYMKKYAHSHNGEDSDHARS